LTVLDQSGDRTRSLDQTPIRHAATIPILIVTGALGAGKTALLQRLLSGVDGSRYAVIVNEFAPLGVDQHILETAAGEIVLLDNGCFCCRTGNSLSETLMKLFEQRRAGQIDDFEGIIVETSGLSDPVAMLQDIARDTEASRIFHVNAILTVVDATAGSSTVEKDEVSRRQVAFATTVILSKTELVGFDERTATENTVSSLNPYAAIVHALQESIELSDFFRRSEFAVPTPQAFISRHHHRRDIQHHIVNITEPLSWTGFTTALEAIAALRGPDLLRVKGIVHAKGYSTPIVYHRVQHVTYPPSRLSRWPNQIRQTELVFITRNIPGASVELLIRSASELAEDSKQ